MSLIIALIVVVSPAAAVHQSNQEHCEINLGGIWGGSSPDDFPAICYDTHYVADILCGDSAFYVDVSYFAARAGVIGAGSGDCHEFPTVFPPPPTSSPPVTILPSYIGMRREGVCKLLSVQDGFLGGTIIATLKGLPSSLTLWLDGHKYNLPMVPGSEVWNGDGTTSAQFYTVDPATSQPLVPRGDYRVSCKGPNGEASDGSIFVAIQ